jgi:phosphoribosylglycinamide formyltransferase-1
MSQPLKRIAIFASGTGSNAAKMIEYVKRNIASFEVCLIASNKSDAGVLQIAAQNHIPTLLIEKERFFKGDGYVHELKDYNIDFIVLAGFLWKVPISLIQAFPNKIVNIHPALLPKYGGKGMYGEVVHEAVIAAKEKESGITIHYVNEQYDEGKHIFAASCIVDENDTASSLARKIHALEHEYYPKVLNDLLKQNLHF